jgi:hypothetical protein
MRISSIESDWNGRGWKKTLFVRPVFQSIPSFEMRGHFKLVQFYEVALTKYSRDRNGSFTATTVTLGLAIAARTTVVVNKTKISERRTSQSMERYCTHISIMQGTHIAQEISCRIAGENLPRRPMRPKPLIPIWTDMMLVLVRGRFDVTGWRICLSEVMFGCSVGCCWLMPAGWVVLAGLLGWI